MSDVKRAVVKRSPDEWRAIVSCFERSGLGCREFCMVSNVNYFFRRVASSQDVTQTPEPVNGRFTGSSCRLAFLRGAGRS